MQARTNAGFTLTELLIVVAIMGIVSAIAVPQYQGYMDASRVSLVQNNLRAIYLQERDYLNSHGVYYKTGAACAQAAAAINTNLFNGKQVLTTDDGYNYCILQATVNDFTAHADEQSGSRDFTIDEDNVDNF